MTKAEKLEYIALLEEKFRRKQESFASEFKRGNYDFITKIDGKKHEKQERALQILTDNEHVEFLYGGAAGGAKSWTGCTWLAFMCLCYPGTKWFIGRESLKRLRESTLITFYKVCSTYGFQSKYKLRCAIFSPLNGDSLYPYFDETGDMTAFSREFSLTSDGKKVNYFETYTAEMHYMFKQSANGYEIVEGFPKQLLIGKIPVIYGKQDQVEWADVQNLIDRLEKLLSNFADTNDYHASPKIVVKGELTGFAKKGEAGAILQLEGDNASASYLSWQDANGNITFYQMYNPDSVHPHTDPTGKSIKRLESAAFNLLKNIL